jgi:hypothetical protein
MAQTMQCHVRKCFLGLTTLTMQSTGFICLTITKFLNISTGRYFAISAPAGKLENSQGYVENYNGLLAGTHACTCLLHA